jgi:hypothetical protein
MKHILPLPDTGTLRTLLDYDPETGTLYRRKRNGLKKVETRQGLYLSVCLRGKVYTAHRVIWKWYYGEEVPEGMHIDHINRNPLDNRIANLRVVTPYENFQNTDTPPRPVIITYPGGRKLRVPSINAAAQAIGVSWNTARACADRPTPLKKESVKGINLEYCPEYPP